MQLQWCAIEQLLPYKKNPRLNQKAVNKVAKSLTFSVDIWNKMP